MDLLIMILGFLAFCAGVDLAIYMLVHPGEIAAAEVSQLEFYKTHGPAELGPTNKYH